MEAAAEPEERGAKKAKLGLRKKAVAPEKRVTLGGYKLRGGTVPWRYARQAAGGAGAAAGGPRPIELMLIEGINTPGQWSFPGGSLDPGEEVSLCAARETEEESGSVGVVGCFLGLFQERPQPSGLPAFRAPRR